MSSMIACNHAAAAVLAATIALGFATQTRTATGAEQDRAVVMLAERRDAEASLAVIRAVEAQLSDVSARLQVSWTEALGADLPAQIATAEELARESDAIAVFWCDLRRADRIYLFLAAPRGGRILVRELGGSGAGGLAEALAIIVRDSVEAVLAGGRIGEIIAPNDSTMGSSAGAPATSPSPVVRSAEDGERLSLALAYQLDVVSAAEPLAHAAALALSLRLTGPLHLTAGYAIAAPLEAEERQVLLRLWRHPIRLGGRVSWDIGRIVLAATIEFELDFATEEVRPLTPDVTVTSGGLQLQPSIAPSLRVGVRLVHRLQLFLSTGVDIALHRTRYVIETADGPVELLSTWPTKPRFLAGLDIALW